MVCDDEQPFQYKYHKMPINRCSFFLIIWYAGSFIYGEIGSFALIKQPMSEEFNFSKTFLGVLDMVRQIGHLFGNFYTLFYPLTHPRRDFFFFTSIKSLLILMFPLGKFIEHNQPFYLVLSMGVGFLKLQIPCVFYMISQYYDTQSDQLLMNVVLSSTFLGDTFALIIGKVVISIFHWDWSIFIVIYAVLLFLAGLLVYLFLSEYPIRNEQQFESVTQFIQDKLNCLKEVIYEPKRASVLLEQGLLSALYYNILLWFPFYFADIGYEEEAIYLSVLAPTLICVGSLSFECLTSSCLPIKHWIITVFIAVGMTCFFVMLGVINQSKSTQTIMVLFILVFGSNFMLSGPFNSMAMLEFSVLSSDNRVASMYIFILYNLIKNIFNTFSLLLIGYLLQSSKQSFVWILGINSAVALGIDIFRNVFMDRRAIYQQTIINDSSSE